MNYAERRDKELLSEPGTTIVPPGPGWGSFLLSLLLAALLAGLFVWSADKAGDHGAGATGIGSQDARTMELLVLAGKGNTPDENAGVTENFQRGLPHVTDGRTQPLWPWLMSGMVDAEHRSAPYDAVKFDDLHRRVHKVHIWMIAGFVMLCGLMAARTLHPGAVLPALLPGALLALLPYGPDFGPTGMNYMLVFLCWVYALLLLQQNSVWLHAIFGLLTGLAWLTDMTGLFIVAAWLIAGTGRWVWTSLRQGEQPVHETWIARNHFVGLVAMVLAWVFVCGPRLGAAMDHWGRPLFSWQQHWMWLDSSIEAQAVTDRYEETRALEDGKRMDLPGWSDYWKNHTADQARERLRAGTEKVWKQFSEGSEAPPGRWGGFRDSPALRQRFWLTGAAVLFLIAGGVAVIYRQRRRGRDGHSPPSFPVATVLFVVVAAGLYGVWYAWYEPVESDPRLPMVLYMPVVWSLVCGAEKLMSLARMRGASLRVWLGWRALLWTYTAVMVADVCLLLRGTDVADFLR